MHEPEAEASASCVEAAAQDRPAFAVAQTLYVLVKAERHMHGLMACESWTLCVRHPGAITPRLAAGTFALSATLANRQIELNWFS